LNSFNKSIGKDSRDCLETENDKNHYQNKMFGRNFKKLYGVFRQRNSNVKNTPTKEEAEKFWKELFGKNNRDITSLLPTQS
jgi:hypothetical protein